MAYLGATMTLPGIAGFILTIGMGVDSNVLIFERIKEEMATAKGADGGRRGRLRSRLPDHSRHARRLARRRRVPLPVRHRPDSRVRDDADDRPALPNVFTAVFVSRTLFELVLSRRQATKLSI